MSTVELPRWEDDSSDTHRCLAAIDDWARTFLNSEILDAFAVPDVRALLELSGDALFQELDTLAATLWDYRRGKERNLATDPHFSAEQEFAIAGAATALGLDGTPSPLRTQYDAVILTGGMVRAGIVKPRFLRELTDAGLTWSESVFLGGFRPFAGDEVGLARALGVGGDNEFDSMVSGMRFAFGLGKPDSVVESARTSEATNSNAQWREQSWKWKERVIRVVAAPSSEPERRRANTVDTYRFWASRATGIRSVLVITTPIYVPYQAAGAVQIFGLEYGWSVETVAVSTAAGDLGEHSQEFLPMHQAQELRSAIHGMRALRRSLVARS